MSTHPLPLVALIFAPMADNAGRDEAAQGQCWRSLSGCDSVAEWNDSAITMSTAKKSSATAAPAPTKGVIIARANRSECNTLSNDERAALTSRAMNLIYGSHVPQVPARRR